MNFRRVSMILAVLMLQLSVSPAFAERDFSKLNLFFDYIDDYYYETVDEEALFEELYQSLFNSLDPNSAYFAPEEYRIFTEDSEGSFGGIGVTISKEEGYITVVQVFDYSPAGTAGVAAGDRIVAVDGEEIEEVPLDVAAAMIRGEVGTEVILTLEREGRTFSLEVIRDVITIENATHEIIDGIGYLRISRFAENVNIEIHEAIRDFIQADVKGIVVDLRDNSGGRVDVVVSAVDLFLPQGDPILRIDYRAYRDEFYESRVKGLAQPLVVMVNGASASASEIFAAAIKDNDRGIILGETTYGKGTVQSVMPLTDRTGFKLTVAQYLSAKGGTIEGVGVLPDIEFHDSPRFSVDFAPLKTSRDLYIGESSLTVYGVQERLVALGAEIEKDGVLGPRTLGAVNDFLKARDRETSTFVSKETLTYMEAFFRGDSGEDPMLLKALELLQ
ncbi:MAG: hypothetical protein AVO33_02150 [delta proteobacterium ML8_F1]|nr:MAG: hypothetical protein AVO33_02150 [delta proteobacterium ML8_F1]